MRQYKSIIGIVVFLLLWQTVGWLHLLNLIYFATPHEVIKESMKMFRDGSIFMDTSWTLYRVILSLFLAALIGIPLGIILGYLSSLYQYCEEILDFLRSLPPIVIYPLLLISLGVGERSRIGVAFFGSLLV